MLQKSNHRFLAFDATPIHFELTQPNPDTSIRANLLIVHGAGEYAARYDPFTAFLASYGIASYAIDLRGFGESGGARAYAHSFKDYAADISALWQKMGADSSCPRFLFGHSLGGLIASFSAPGLLPLPTGMVLSSPCFGLGFKLPPHLWILSKLTAILSPKFSHKTLVVPERLTHDPEIIRQWHNDKRITRVMSSRLFDLMRRAMKTSSQIASQIRFPVLICQAGSDVIVNPQASGRFFKTLSAADKTLKFYPGFFHEVLNEVGRKSVYADMLDWINTRI